MKAYQFVSPIAHLIAMVGGCKAALRITGIAPYRPTSAESFIVDTWEKAETFTVAAPKSVNPLATWEKFPEDRIKHHYLAVVENGIAFSHGVVLGPDGAHIPGVSHKTDENVRRRRKRQLFGTPISPYRLFPKPLRIDSPVVVATVANQHYYFHWLYDVLPRLFRVRTGAYFEAPVFVDASRPFQRQSLELLGIDAAKILNASETPLITSNCLVVPCYQCALGCSIPGWVIDGLRGLIPKGILGNGENRRIYLSRADAPHRRISNEKALVDLLQKYGFETVLASELSFIDQARLFDSASHIISPHGGGLANLVFCQPGTNVLELFPHVTQDVYYRISHARGLNYQFLKAPTTSRSKIWPGLSDHDVDLNLVEVYLKDL